MLWLELCITGVLKVQEKTNGFWVWLFSFPMLFNYCICMAPQAWVIFSLIWFLLKKIIKLNFFKKNRNQTEIGSNRPVSVRFFRTKTGSNRFGSVSARFFAGLTWFFSVWVRFGFFSFRLIKPKPNRTGWFFQNFNRFFFTVRFFRLFFFWFFCSPLLYVTVFALALKQYQF